MFLGTGKIWWFATIALVVAGLIVTSRSAPLGLLMLVAGMILFSVAPRKKGPPPQINLGNLQIVNQLKGAVNSVSANASGAKPAGPLKPAARPAPPRPVMRPAPEIKPRAKIEISGRDADEV
ncbi:MAG: hypothetical protein ACKOWF_17860 [Chloroflexota bacterium]